VAAHRQIVFIGDVIGQRGAKKRHTTFPALTAARAMQPHPATGRWANGSDAFMMPGLKSAFEIVGVQRFKIVVIKLHSAKFSLQLSPRIRKAAAHRYERSKESVRW
jgi:hypothetical protein